jgi:methylated-DNA-[protein]-cysteine S-methyltransferase
MVKNAEKFYGYMDSPLGVLEIICFDEIILSVKYADKPRQNNKNSLVENVLVQLQEYFEGKRKKFDLPLEFSGTEFQKQAWRELMNIPYGQTISYQEQATKLGNPKAIRAVGSANGKNEINIIIPCHRVIGKNGKLVGYGGGLSRKEWLVGHEKRHDF